MNQQKKSLLLGIILFILVGQSHLSESAEKSSIEDNQPNTITNGTEVTDETLYPWMAALMPYKDASQYEVMCGGTVISKEYVITAAHCVTYYWEDDPSLHVYIGGTDVLEGEQFAIDEIIIHPDYNEYNYESHYDIALLRLEREYTGETVALPTYDTYQEVNNLIDTDRILALGRGLMDQSTYNEGELKQAFISLSDTSECEYSGTPYTLCQVRTSNGRGVCYGDSGGPILKKNDNGKWVIIGTTSYGGGTHATYCEDHTYAVYMNITHHIYWANSVLGEEFINLSCEQFTDVLYLSECNTLETLVAKYHLFPEHWRSLSLNPCDWNGIYCNNGQIASLTISSPNLETLGEEIAQFSALEALHIENNPMLKTISPALKDLSTLTELYISNNPLLETMPSLDESPISYLLIEGNQQLQLKNLALPISLQSLRLIDNLSMTHLPEISHLEDLRVLKIGDNSTLKEIPESIASLSTLEYLIIERNHGIQEIPESIVEELFPNMYVFDINLYSTWTLLPVVAQSEYNPES